MPVATEGGAIPWMRGAAGGGGGGGGGGGAGSTVTATVAVRPPGTLRDTPVNTSETVPGSAFGSAVIVTACVSPAASVNSPGSTNNMPVGAAVTVTGSVKAPMPVTVTLTIPEAPGVSDRAPGAADSMKSCCTAACPGDAAGPSMADNAIPAATARIQRALLTASVP